MRSMLLGLAAPLAALALPAAPAHAQASDDPPPTAAPDGPFDRWAAPPSIHGGFPLDHHDGRRHRRFPGVVVFGGPWAAPEAWALYNNRSWEPDSFNDWWHDRPDRAYPRWMQSNQNCQRLWWSGGGWRC